MNCEYCDQEDTENIIREVSKSEEVFVFIEGDRLFLQVFDIQSINSYGAMTKINYCPKCGRELKKS